GGHGGGDAGSGRGRERQEGGRDLGARTRHPRGRIRPHGQRPPDRRPQQVAAGPRREEPLRDGRLLLRLVRLPEPDHLVHGPRRAGLRLFGRGVSGGQGLAAAVRPLRWGLLGAARINRSVIPAIRESPRSELVAVASRDPARAAAYAHEWGIPRSFGRYEEMLADDEIDVVYNPLPNGLHA